MKHRGIWMLSCLVLLLTGCGEDDQSKAHAYQINGEHKLSDTASERLNLESEKERFVFQRTAGEKESGMFYFHFSGNNSFSYYTSSDFTYLDTDGKSISFEGKEGEERTSYSFYGSLTIYISYTNANKDIKDIIDSREFTISTGSTHWFSESSLFE